MHDHNENNSALSELARLADDAFDTLAERFPVCMGSDEFHFFPQARARDFTWSRWDDFSPTGIDDTIGRLHRWDHALENYLAPPSSSAGAIDADMLQRVLRTLGDQLAHARVHQTQPTFYLTIVGIGLAEAMTTGPEPLNARLASLPAFLDQARRNLQGFPRLFRDMGTDMLGKQQEWIALLPLAADIRAPLEKAYQRLETQLAEMAVTESFLPPVALYERIAYHHMGCQLPLDDIARELEQELAETRALAEQAAAAIAPGEQWPAVVDALPRPAVTAGGAGDIYETTISELNRHCTTQGLVSAGLIQQCPVTVEPIPVYMRPVRSNAAYSMPPQHPPRGGTFYIQDTGADAWVPADYRLLSAHETFPGHHLLDTSRWNHARPVRRHIEFPLFYEGWASFAEELLFDTGFFSGPADHLLMAKRRFWRALRGQVDFDIHTRRRTLDEATAVLCSAGMSHGQATAMVRRYCLKPGYQLAYTIGRCRFRRLYDTNLEQGADPGAFARCILAQGEIGFQHLSRILQRRILQQGGKT